PIAVILVEYMFRITWFYTEIDVKTASILIIGAGVIGTSIAFHLAKQGCNDVVVLEKNYIGSGSTEKCAGGIRQQFSLEADIRLSMESVKFFSHFEDETGHHSDFRQNGYLILATTDDDMKALRQNVEQQRTLGLEVDLLSSSEVMEMVPQLRPDDILGGSFCRSDGYADPYSVVNGFASAARKHGVQIIEDTEIIEITEKKNGVKEITTNGDKLETPVIVNAAGPYAKLIGKMIGLDIPVCPAKRHIFITETIYHSEFIDNPVWARFPMIVDFHSGLWLRREGPCLIFGKRNPEEPEGFDMSIDWDYFTEIVGPEICYRFPIFENIGIMRAQAGLHSDTPDNMAILGNAPGLEGVYLACGFSGHGFMHSPAVGRIMAELILNGETSFTDISLFCLDRFKKPVQIKETSFI
ncbi:MAG: FAD-binding oxidoreductase, partial [Dehalococcoidales bacterium]